MKRFWIWAGIMAGINVIFGLRLGLLPGILLSWIVSDAVDKSEKDKAKHKSLDEGYSIRCPKCYAIINKTNSYCNYCGERITDDGDRLNTITKEDISILNRENKDTLSEYKNEDKKDVDKENSIESEIKSDIDIKELNNQSLVIDDKNKKEAFTSIEETKTLYCKYCGSKLYDEAKFCHKCGKEL